MNTMNAQTVPMTGPVEKKFSNIDGKVCKLKMKVFSSDGVATVLDNVEPEVISIELPEQKIMGDSTVEDNQKEFSAATIRERVRMAKFSVRQRFRRMIIDYKKFYEISKGKMTHDDFVLVKGLFTADVMNIMNVVTPEIRKGKQINTLLGLSAFGKELRLAGQKLQIPYRLAMNEEVRVGAVSKKRWQDISKAYNEFIDAMLKYTFGEDYRNIGAGELAAATESVTSDVQPTNIKG